MSKQKDSVIVKNKTASRNFILSDSYQAGIVLEGWEVKSLRNNKVDVKDCYVSLKKGEAWLIGMKVDPPASLKHESIDPTRSRKLLLHKKEIRKISGKIKKESLTLIPTKIYFNKKGIAKLEIALSKGKKLHDKREVKKKRSWEREKKSIR